jgi:hypothetical protein
MLPCKGADATFATIIAFTEDRLHHPSGVQAVPSLKTGCITPPVHDKQLLSLQPNALVAYQQISADDRQLQRAV